MDQNNNNNFKDKFQKCFDAVKTFCMTKQRYIYAAVLLIVMITVLIQCTGPKWTNRNSEDTQSSSQMKAGALEDFKLDDQYEQNKNADLNALIEQYFVAYANNDMDTLKTAATPVSDNEAGYIAVLSQYIESAKIIF